MNRIWEAKLDERYDCFVERVDERNGTLHVVDLEENKSLLDVSVGLSYGAMFGPDMGDVALWQDLCVNAVDGKPQ